MRSADIIRAWDVSLVSIPKIAGHRLSIVRNQRDGRQRYYVDDAEVDVNRYLAVTGAHAKALEKSICGD
jgi:hypothetical protein